jgi:hypothetical protein
VPSLEPPLEQLWVGGAEGPGARRGAGEERGGARAASAVSADNPHRENEWLHDSSITYICKLPRKVMRNGSMVVMVAITLKSNKN